MAVEARVDEPGSGVDQEAEATETRLPFDAGNEIVGDTDAFGGRAQHELTGVEYEDVIAADLDQLGQVFLVLLHVDDSCRVVTKHPEVAVHGEVDRRRLHVVRHERVNQDSPTGDLLTKGAVREDHALSLAGATSRVGSATGRVDGSAHVMGWRG